MENPPDQRKSGRGSVSPTTPSRIPFWLKVAYSAFMAVLIPVYWHSYGPTTFLNFCDIALVLTLAGMWTENSLLISMSAVGILVPQVLWVIDFAAHFAGYTVTGTTAYMFAQDRPLFLRGLSLFHGWLPFLLVYLVAKLGYNRRALPVWTALAWTVCLICYFFLPPAGAHLPDANLHPWRKGGVNINYVFGLDNAKPQAWMPAGVYLVVWMTTMLGLSFTPTHLLLRKLFTQAQPDLARKTNKPGQQ